MSPTPPQPAGRRHGTSAAAFRAALVAAALPALLAGCSAGRIFDGTPYTGDIMPTVPRPVPAAAPELPPELGGPTEVPPGELEPPAPPPEVPPPDPDEMPVPGERPVEGGPLPAEPDTGMAPDGRWPEGEQFADASGAPAGPAEPAAPPVSHLAPRPASPDTFPNLADVPPRPTDLPGREERQRLLEELTADRDLALIGRSGGAAPEEDGQAPSRTSVIAAGAIPAPPTLTPLPEPLAGDAGAVVVVPAVPPPPPPDLGARPGTAGDAAVRMPEMPAIPEPPELGDVPGDDVPGGGPDAEVAAIPEQPEIPDQPTFGDPADAAVEAPEASVPMVVPEPPEPAEPEESVRVASIFFERGQADLANRDIDVLRLAVSERAARQGVIRIVGHADDADPAVADQIARDRADAIASALIRLGVLPSQMRLETGAETESALEEAAEIYLDY